MVLEHNDGRSGTVRTDMPVGCDASGRRRAVRSGGNLSSSDNERDVRDGELLASIGVVLPDRDYACELFVYFRLDLQLQRYRHRHMPRLVAIRLQ